MSLKSTYKEKAFLLKCLNIQYKGSTGSKKKELEKKINKLINELEELYKKIK